MKGHYGSPEFAANYRAAMEGSEAVEKKGLSIPGAGHNRGSVAHLSRLGGLRGAIVLDTKGSTPPDRGVCDRARR